MTSRPGFDRTLDAVVLDAEAAEHCDESALRHRIERLLSAGVHISLVTRRPPVELDGLAAPWPHGSGRLRAVPDGDAASGYRVALEELASHGVAAESVGLLVGDVDGTRGATEGYSPVVAVDHALLDHLDDQLWRRAGLAVPPWRPRPGWSVTEDVAPHAAAHPRDVLFTLGDGAFGTRGGLEEVPGAATVLASGVWAGKGGAQHLLSGPQWTGLHLAGPAAGGRRMLDLREGILLREDGADPAAGQDAAPVDPAAGQGDQAGGMVRIVRLASAARPGVHLLRAEGPAGRFAAGAALSPPGEHGDRVTAGRDGPVEWMIVEGSTSALVAAAVQTQTDRAGRRTVMRLAAYRAGPKAETALADAVDAVRAAQLAGFDQLVAEHRRAWADRWAIADVEIPADPAAELAVRFTIFQLWVNAGWAIDGSLGDEQAVGARGLSGPGYAGHVFWDADVFVLPAVATLEPAAARAMLQYRIRRLPQARAHAAESGRTGARFPWESAQDGTEVTPSSILLGNQPIAVRTGELEEHITADVAWAADRYAVWTGDGEFLAGPGRDLIVETARYWADRIRVDADGRGHIDDVIGADEYHEDVDDDVFTNVMARWNLRRGAALLGTASPEAAHWLGLAEALVVGHDPVIGHHEQFAGYLALTPLAATDVAPLPFAADLVLGQERVRTSQLIKQADVLMAHFLVPDEMAAGSLHPDLDLYVPQTSHGSSLSPAVTAGVLARGGRADEALDTCRLALRLDLDDLTGSGTKGLHLATLGGVWQCLLTGFLGLSVEQGVLHVDPRLPAAWPSVTARARFLGARVSVTATAADVRVTTDRPVRVSAPGYRPLLVLGTVTFDRD